MATPDTSAEFQRSDLKTRQDALFKSLPTLFKTHPQETVRTAWGVHTTHQPHVTRPLSAIFAAETSSELRRAITGEITRLRKEESPYSEIQKKKERIFERNAPDEAQLAQKLEAYDTGRRGTQGERKLYDVIFGTVRGRYNVDRDMEVAMGRRNFARINKIYEDANKGSVDDLQRMKFAAALYIGQLGLLIPGQPVTAKQTLRGELDHITYLIRAGAVKLEPGLVPRRQPTQEQNETGASEATTVVTRDQLQPPPGESAFDDLIASVRGDLPAKETPAAEAASTAETAAGLGDTEAIENVLEGYDRFKAGNQ